MGCLSACAGNILKKMTESSIGAELLSGRSQWEAKSILPFHCTAING